MRYYILATILFLVGAVVLPFQAHTLTISPVKMEISGERGQTLIGELTLFNEQDETMTFYSSVENFEARGETGVPYFLPEKVGLALWIETEEQVTLKPKEEKIIPFTIQIPQDAEPGGYFAAILWGTTPPEVKEAGQVAVGGRLGVLILLRVAGEIKEAGDLLEFGTKDKQKFFSSLPITFVYRFNNAGGDRVVPRGEITIKNLFGFTSATLPANKGEGSVLPNSTRKFEVIWEGKESEVPQMAIEKEEKLGFFGAVKKQWRDFHFGRYVANLNLIYGGQNETAKASFSFFIIPWQLLIIVVIILAAIIILGWIGIRKYNRWIITKALGQSK